jgi:hypothetical protein
MSSDAKPTGDWGSIISVILVLVSVLGLLYITMWNR